MKSLEEIITPYRKMAVEHNQLAIDFSKKVSENQKAQKILESKMEKYSSELHVAISKYNENGLFTSPEIKLAEKNYYNAMYDHNSLTVNSEEIAIEINKHRCLCAILSQLILELEINKHIK